MNFRIKRVRIERVRIALARPILSKRFWIAAILFQGWAFSSLPGWGFSNWKPSFLACCLVWSTIMRPKQRKVAAKNMLELRTAEVDADSVGSDTSLSAACRCCNSGDSFSARMNFRRHSLSRGEGQGLGRRHEVTELLRHNSWAPSAMSSNSSQTGKTNTATLSRFADEEGGLRLGTLDTQIEVDLRTWLHVPSGTLWSTYSDTHKTVELKKTLLLRCIHHFYMIKLTIWTMCPLRVLVVFVKWAFMQ